MGTPPDWPPGVDIELSGGDEQATPLHAELERVIDVAVEFLFTLEAGRVQYANDALLSELGYEPGDLRGASLEALVHPDPKYAGRFDVTDPGALADALAGDGTVRDLAVPLRAADGSVLPVGLSAVAVAQRGAVVCLARERAGQRDPASGGQDVGERHGQADALNGLGIVAWNRGAVERAREYHERSLAIAEDIGGRKSQALSLTNLGLVARHRGAYDRAREFLERSLAIDEDIGDRQGQFNSLTELSAVARRRGDLETGRAFLEQASDVFADLDAPLEEGRALALEGRVAARSGERDRAREPLQEALSTFEAIDAYPDALGTLERLVEVALEDDDADRAREWVRRTRALLEDAPAPVAERHDEWVEEFESTLGVSG